MRDYRVYLAIAVLGVLATAACSDRANDEAGSVSAGEITITRAVIPAPVTAGDRQAALYMTIHNGGVQPDLLVGMSSLIADSVTLHTMQQDGGMMRMVPLGRLPIPAGENTILEPGQRHGMLEGLHRQLQVGDTIRVTVRFANAGETEVAVPVVPYDQIRE